MTFFGTANIITETGKIGIDALRFEFNILEEAEEDKTTDVFPNAQTLNDVAKLEATL